MWPILWTQKSCAQSDPKKEDKYLLKKRPIKCKRLVDIKDRILFDVKGNISSRFKKRVSVAKDCQPARQLT